MLNDFIRQVQSLQFWQKLGLGTLFSAFVLVVLYSTGVIELPGLTKQYSCKQVSNFMVLDVSVGEKFEPNNVDAYLCDHIRFTATDNRKHWPAVGPHPTHSSYPGFDSRRDLGFGESYEFTLNRPGTFSFHDHTHPELSGQIVIVDHPRSLTPAPRPQ